MKDSRSVVDRLQRPLQAAILALALVLRTRLLFSDVYFDEAWYFYLARHLGGSPLRLELFWGSGRTVDSALHFLARPAAYLAFWPAAQLGLTACRIANVLLGCLLVGLVMHSCQVLKISRPLGWFAGLACALNPAQVVWSSYFFPDVLGEVLVLLALLATLKRRGTAALYLLALATLVKEVFLANLLVALLTGPRSRKVLLALLPYGLLFGYLVGYRGMPLQGWAGAFPLDYNFLRCAGCDLVGLAVVLGLLATRQRRLALWALAMPLFYGLRELLQHGPGVQLWYAVECLPLMLIATAQGLDLLARPGEGGLRRPWLVAALAGIALGSGLTFNWPNLERAQTPTYYLQDVLEKVRQLHPGSILLISCPWQFPAYPFGGLVPQVMASDWQTERVQELLPQAQYVLVMVPPGPRRWLPFESLLQPVYRNPGYQLYTVKP